MVGSSALHSASGDDGQVTYIYTMSRLDSRCFKAGIRRMALRHGPHHVAHKSISTALPLYGATIDESMSSPISVEFSSSATYPCADFARSASAIAPSIRDFR